MPGIWMSVSRRDIGTELCRTESASSAFVFRFARIESGSQWIHEIKQGSTPPEAFQASSGNPPVVGYLMV